MKDLFFRIGLGLFLIAAVGCGREPDRPRPADQTPATTQSPPAAPAPQASIDDRRAMAVEVADVDIGRSIKDDKTIDDKTQSFKPTDTVYVSVKTKGTAPSAKVEARLTYQDGQLVKQMEQTIAPDGEEITEFHASKPDGWPAGEYKVEVLIDGKSADTQDFKVS